VSGEHPHLRVVPDPERRPARYTHCLLSAEERGQEVDDATACAAATLGSWRSVRPSAKRLRGLPAGDDAA